MCSGARYYKRKEVLTRLAKEPVARPRWLVNMIDGPIRGLRADKSGLGIRSHLPTVSPMADPRGMAYLQEVSTLKGSHVMSSDRKALLGAYKERYQGHMVDPKHRRIRLIGKRVMRESQRQQQALEVRGPSPSYQQSCMSERDH